MKKSEKIVKELSDEELMDITGGSNYGGIMTINLGEFRPVMFYGTYLINRK